MRKLTKIIIVVVVLLLAVVVYNSTKVASLNYTSAKVERGDVVQTVSATGAVEAAKKIDLKFMGSEKIEEINVKVGSEVKEGDVLAKLNASKLSSQLLQAEASLVAAQANLQTVLNGSTNEQVQVSATTAENAQIALQSAKQTLEDTKVSTQREIASAESSLESAKISLVNANANLANVKVTNENSTTNVYEAAWDGVTAALAICDDALNTNMTVLENDDAENTLGVLNSQTVSISNASKLSARNSYDSALSFKQSVASDVTEANIDLAVLKTQDALEKTRVTLSDTYSVLQATITSSALTQAELDALKANISGSRTGINNAISTLTGKRQAISTQKVANQNSLTSAESSVSSATSALSVAESSLLSVKSSATAKINSAQNAVYAREGDVQQMQDSLSQVSANPEYSKVLAAQAQVDQAKASRDLIENQIDDTVLLAPHDGIVTAVNGEVGELSSMSEPFVSIIIPNGFEIKANISEVEIAKLKVDDTVEITFDALGMDQIFTGEISEIDPAETEISGVIYYKVTTLFTGDGEIIKPGMTANLDILTAKKENVLKIPFQALKEKDSGKYVQVVVNNEIQEIPVEVGLKGDANYEVVKGIEEGREVVTFIEEQK